LPSLLQNYGDDLQGHLLFTLLEICSTLQTSKHPPVSITAIPTFQQLLSSLYERLAAEDRKPKSNDDSSLIEVSVGDGKLAIRPVAHDAFRVLKDLCLLLEGSKPENIKLSPTQEVPLLELLESVLAANPTIIASHPEQAELVRSILLPHVIQRFSEKNSFPLTVRVIRILFIVLKHHIDLFPDECENILNWLNHSLDPDASILWKRILCVEVFREVFSLPSLVVKIHSRFNGMNGRKAIIPDCLAAFVRLATEKPALIGLGQQSTLPIGHYFQRDGGQEAAADQSLGSGASASAAGVPTSPVPGISAQFSAVKTMCVEQLDKIEPPNTPETYIYSLVLASLNNFSESLAKFILPLTVHKDDRSKKRHKPDEQEEQDSHDGSGSGSAKALFRRSKSLKIRSIPVNPLELESHPFFSSVQTVADLIEKSWHAVLVCCSTFFSAALDSDNYRSLVKSYQKFTQVFGLLRMVTARDAFLTTLGKSAMPPNLYTAGILSASSQTSQAQSLFSNAKGLLNVDSIVSQASSLLPDRRRNSIESGEPTLNTRHLLCLRALLNLAIALGPTLEESWHIVFETLQQADRVLSMTQPRLRDSRQHMPASEKSGTPSDASHPQLISTEIAAVQAAATRLFESTTDFPNDEFTFVLKALCELVQDVPGSEKAQSASPPMPGHQRRVASFSGLSIKTGIQEHDFIFALSKTRQIASLNLDRFVSYSSEESGWSIILTEVAGIATKMEVPETARLLAVDLIRRLVLDTISFPFEEGDDREAEIQARALLALTSVTAALNDAYSKSMDGASIDETTIEVHGIILETLKGVLEHTGENLANGWSSVFDIILSAFKASNPQASAGQGLPALTTRSHLISVHLGRSAFNSLQLICSDFLSPALDSSLHALINLMYHFGSQGQDLNISLTVRIFWPEVF
jgi:hypothetical protein